MSSPRLLAGLLLLVAACAERTAPAAPRLASAAGAEICRIGPEGGPPAPSTDHPAPLRTATDDRGIGGTGIQLTSAPAPDDDRGIGGTGIVGVVTGFASICVNGIHIGYDSSLPVVFGETMEPPAALRVGQVVVVSAAERHGALQARRVSVRYEVSGPVEEVRPGELRVAGQRVTMLGAVPGGTGWKVGDTVMVSGLRAPDGSISASRIDPRPADAPRTVTVYGVLAARNGAIMIGHLPIRAEPGLLLPDPGPVIATGLIEDGVMLPVAVVPDMLLRDPAVWFGPSYGRFLYEGYVSLRSGMVMLGSMLHAPAPAGVAPFSARRGVVDLRPAPTGGLTAASLRDPAGAPITGGPLGQLRQAPMTGGTRGEIAPMPDRGFERRQGLGGEAAGRGAPSGQRGRRDRPDANDRSNPGGGFQGGAAQGGTTQGMGPPGGGRGR